MITFLWPLAFILLPLPFIARRILKPVASSPAGALKVPFFNKLVQGQSLGKPVSKRHWLTGLMAFIAWTLLISALARPALVGDKVPLPAQGRDIMMAIDLSGSMQEQDFSLNGHKTTRLNVIKQAASDFIERRQGDRVGLVLFSDRAYLQAPLTFDLQVVAKLLEQAQVGLTGQRTAIGDAIAISVKRLKDRPEEGRVLVLMTDGANNQGVLAPLKAAQIAKKLGIRIYTIGIGADNQAVQTPFGLQMLNPAADLDEGTLQEIATLTGGDYFRAKDVQGLANIYDKINQLEPVSGEPIFVRPEVALFFWPAGLALLIITLLIFFRAMNRLSQPRTQHITGQ